MIVVDSDTAVSEQATTGQDTSFGVSGASLQIGQESLLKDTSISLIKGPTFFHYDNSGTPVGNTYEFSISEFDAVISGYVTVTVPYEYYYEFYDLTEGDLRA